MNYAEIWTSIKGATLPWLASHGFKVIGLIVGAIIVRVIAHFVIEKAIRTLVRSSGSKDAEEKRENTLIRVFSKTSSIVIWIVVIMMILSELGVDVGPLIAAAGVIGLALGFGGQYLIKDLIAGLFILLENQYRVGDAVILNNVSGVVEDFSLRTTMIRDLDGVLHYIPNGGIAMASNKAKGFSRVNLDVGVAYDSDLDKVKAVINEVGKTMAADSEWKDIITKAPEFLRIENLGPSEIIIKILGEVKPAKHVAASGELRKRLKEAFEKEGIEIPFPQQVVHHKQD